MTQQLANNNVAQQTDAGGVLKAKAARAISAFSSNPGIAYTLLRKEADGAYTAVPPDTVFRPGDSVRVQVQPSQAGSLNLFRRDANSAWDLLATQSVEGLQSYVLPEAGGVQANSPGEVELLLTLSQAGQPGVSGSLAKAAPQKSVKIKVAYR
jgi:hypothetical protein